jgi:hypothetical protein
MMRCCFEWFGGLLATLCLGTPGFAADFKVIANPSVAVTSVTVDELRSLFLQTSTSLKKCGHVEPIRQKGGAIHETFSLRILGMSPSALLAYYRQQVLTGTGGMPRLVDGDDGVATYVKNTKGAIGYVNSNADVHDVVVIRATGN